MCVHYSKLTIFWLLKARGTPVVGFLYRSSVCLMKGSTEAPKAACIGHMVFTINGPSLRFHECASGILRLKCQLEVGWAELGWGYGHRGALSVRCFQLPECYVKVL